MRRTRQTIARATRRMVLVGWVRTLAITLALGLGVVLAVRVVEKLGPPMSLPWAWIAGGAGAGAVVLALVWAWVRRPDDRRVARTLDDRAGLRESLSTALHVGDRGDGWARLIVDTAEQRATAVDVNRALPVRFGARWWTPVILAAGVLAVWWLPGYDLTGRQQQARAEEEQRREVRTVAAEVRAQQAQLREAMDRAGVDLEGEGDEAFDALDEDATTADDVRRAALRQLTEVTNQLARAQEGERGEEMRSIRDAMRQLRSPGDGPMADLARSLARGNFQDAQRQVEELQRQLDSGEMSDAQRDAAEQALNEMSRQLRQLSQDRSALASALQNAGMSAEQARQAMQNPEAMQQALEQAQNMTPEQREQLQQMMQGMQNAGQAMSNMASAMDQMAGQMQNSPGQQGGQPGDQPSGGQQLSNQLSQMEMLQNDMDALQQAMDQAQQQMQQLGQGMSEGGMDPGENPGQGQGMAQGQGEWAEGRSRQEGNGAGGPGRGRADGTLDPEEADFALQRERERVANRGGPIIGSTVVYGGQVRGEARQTFRDAVSAASADATEAIETLAVPPEYHSAVKHYFGRLDEQGGSAPANEPSPQPAPEPAPEPAPDADDADG